MPYLGMEARYVASYKSRIVDFLNFLFSVNKNDIPFGSVGISISTRNYNENLEENLKNDITKQLQLFGFYGVNVDSVEIIANLVKINFSYANETGSASVWMD